MKQVDGCNVAVTRKREIMRGHTARLLGALWIVAMSIPSAWASETEGSSSEDWSFSATPYFWPAGLKGTQATLPPLPALELDASIGDVLKNLDYGIASMLELRKGKFGLNTDFLLLNLGVDTTVAPIPGLSAGLRVDLTTFVVQMAATYRVLEKEQGWLDLVVGARGWYVDTSLKAHVGPIFRKADHIEGWADALGGIRTRINLRALEFPVGEGLHLAATLLGGGGMSGGFVDLTGGMGYDFTDQIKAFAGYRYLKVDYKNSGFVFDVEMQGPMVSGTYKF
jgi:hypothetical protein